MSDAVSVRVSASLTPDDAERAAAVIEAATHADGQPPLSEHVRLHVRSDHRPGERHSVVHLLAEHDGALAGYGHLDFGHIDPAHVDPSHLGAAATPAPVLELAVSPDHRRHGVGRAIVDAARARTGGPLQLWAHGETGSAAALAASLGFVQTRAIWQMRRSLVDPLPEAPLPTGFTLRTFLPGIDDDAWLAVNARAFADHPEQGLWTAADLLRRIDEPWFSAAGFLIVEDDTTGTITGFHWTKVHGGLAESHSGPSHHGDDHSDHAHEHLAEPPSGPSDAGSDDDVDMDRRPSEDHSHGTHSHDPIGEVYVVGVDPAHHGRGLGKALTIAGLRHLRNEGLPEALLYVDATNTPAIRLYESLGFTKADMDVLYTTP